MLLTVNLLLINGAKRSDFLVYPKSYWTLNFFAIPEAVLE